MSNKLSAYIDLAKLQGAYRCRIKGFDGIFIKLDESRAKVSAKDASRVNLSLSLVPNRDGKDDYGQTHWIVEPTTKEERESQPDAPKLPILGNAREFDDDNKPRATPPKPTTPRPPEGGADDGLEGDDIPF